MPTTLLEPPDDYIRTHDTFCSNFDGVINPGVAEKLKKEKIIAWYPAWDWLGTVWYDRGTKLYCCKVMRHGTHIDTVTATTPDELKSECCDKYGSN